MFAEKALDEEGLEYVFTNVFNRVKDTNLSTFYNPYCLLSLEQSAVASEIM